MLSRRTLIAAAASVLIPIVTLMYAGKGSAATIRVALTEPDQYAIRSMKVVRTAGDVVPGLRAIQSFDTADDAFTFVVATGGTMRLRVAEIGAITFDQQINKMSPAAQDSPWEIHAASGARKTVTIPVTDLKFDQGWLILTDSNSAPQAVQGQVLEISRLTYDSKEKSFLLELQPVHYEKHYLGGGGDGGGGGGSHPAGGKSLR
jgi:hypothetical protein